MILQCSECNTSFLVDNALIGSVGRKVKCANCGHMWFAEPTAKTMEAAEPQQVDALPNLPEMENAEPQLDVPVAETEESDHDNTQSAVGSDILEAVDADSLPATDNDDAMPSYANVPTVAETPNYSGLYAVAACLVFAVVIMSLFTFRSAVLSAFPATTAFYSSFGLAPTDGLVLHDVSFKQLASRNKDRFIVSGEIINLAGLPREVPLLRVGLRDENGVVFLSREYEEQKMLDAKEHFAFKVGRLDTAFLGRAKELVVDIGNSKELGARD